MPGIAQVFSQVLGVLSGCRNISPGSGLGSSSCSLSVLPWPECRFGVHSAGSRPDPGTSWLYASHSKTLSGSWVSL